MRPLATAAALVLLASLLSPTASGQTSPEPSDQPSGAPSPVPSATPVPTWPDASEPGDGALTPGVLAWEPVGPLLPPTDQEIERLVAWNGGFAALELRDHEARSRTLT